MSSAWVTPNPNPNLNPNPNPNQAVLRREFCGSFGRVEVVAEPTHAFDEPETQLRAHAA